MILRIVIIFFVVCLFFGVPEQASAHLPGQPPYFKINGVYSDLYQMQSVFPEIELPQDISRETYLINEPIDFVIDIAKLQQVVPEQIIKKTTFTWKFGDGAFADNKSPVQHAYSYVPPSGKVVGSLVLYDKGKACSFAVPFESTGSSRDLRS